MSKFDIPSILLSLISIAVALWAIVVSRKTANESRRIADEQKNIAHRTQLLESRNLNAAHLGKYSELLFFVQSQTKQYKEELSEAAYSSLNELCMLFDNYGVVPSSPVRHQRQTRHIFHSGCEQLYQAFSRQLSRQRGMNLRIRYNRLRDIDSKELSQSEVEQLTKDAGFEHLNLAEVFRKDINQELEDVVVESFGFRLLVQQLLARVLAKDRPLIFQEALQKLIPFFATYERGEEILSLGQKKLEDGLAQNKLEEFSLKEKPELHAAYKGELAKLETLRNLDLTGIQCLADMQVKNSIPELLYIGAVLYTISMYWDWGNSR